MWDVYTLNAEIGALMLVIESMEDENSILIPDQDLFIKLNNLKMERAFKIAQIGRLFKNYKSEHEAISAEKVKLTKKQDAAKKRMERVKRYLVELMGEGEKYKDGALSIHWTKKQDVLIVDNMDAVPKEFLRIELKKTDIKKQIKKWGTPWARLEAVEGKNIVIK